jgi:hypothetical protein
MSIDNHATPPARKLSLASERAPGSAALACGCDLCEAGIAPAEVLP